MITEDPNPAVPWTGWTWCRVCGERVQLKPLMPADRHRCRKHMHRHACAVEGCKRSTAAPSRMRLDCYLCPDHWKSGVPVGSPERKVMRRIWRIAKRYGWTDELRRREWRIWCRVVAIARARARGDVDMDEINRIMGW